MLKCISTTSVFLSNIGVEIKLFLLPFYHFLPLISAWYVIFLNVYINTKIRNEKHKIT